MRKLTDADLEPTAFVQFMSRIFDINAMELQVHAKRMAPEFRTAIDSHSIREGMTYEMVLLSLGEPEQKKVDTGDSAGMFAETWYYLKNGRRSVLRFEDGKVAKVQTF